ncbi:MAG: hypothetical protein IKZ09_13205 [Clostridia bacterium]|nr:hypothetical protein [Clostridia bacterium]
MKTNLGRITSALLAFLMLASMASCGGGGGEPAAAENAAGETTAAVTEPAEPEFLDGLGEYDFGGDDYNMLIREWKIPDLFVEESIGEVYNDAVYDRNRKIEERFNIEFTMQTLPEEGATWNKALGASVMANDGAYDVVMPDYWWGCETGGYFLNMLDYTDIMDFSQPWWTQGWNDNAEIFGQMYSAVGALCTDLYSNTIAMFFSKSLVGQLDMESPYTLVRDHKWTLEKMKEMSAQSSSDLNGDGVLNLETDQYGIFFDLQSGRALLPSCGWETSTKQADGSYAYEFYNEDFVELCNEIYDIVWNMESVSYNGANAYNAFKNDRLLFLAQGVGAAAYLRDMESDFGIIPYPMRDEGQEDYVSYNFGTFYLAIPKSASDPRMSAVVLEALNAETYHTVKDAYFEINMKEKFSRDEDTREMLDMIVGNVRFDFTFVNEAATDHIVMYFFDQIAAKNNNVASSYEKRAKSYQKKLEKLFETYADAAED